MTTIIPDPQLPRRTESGMHTRAVNAAAGVLLAAMENGRQTPTGLAIALDAACLLNPPEHAHYRAAFEAQQARAETLDGLLRTAQDRITELEKANEGLDDLRIRAIDKNDELRARIAELEAQRERRRVRLVACEADLGEMRGLLSPNGFPRRIPPEVEIHERVAPAVEWLLNRVSELEARLAEYERPADEDPIAYTLTEKATARPGMQPAIRTDAPDFFQPGHTYSSTIFGGPFTVDYVGTNPGSGERYAHGWIHHEHDDSWAPNVVTGLFERFIDITRGGDA